MHTLKLTYIHTYKQTCIHALFPLEQKSKSSAMAWLIVTSADHDVT